MEEQIPPQKQRHGCVTTWLILVIVANAVASLFYLVGDTLFDLNFPGKMQRSFVVLAIIGAFNIFLALTLLRWKLRGFYGFVVTTILSFLISLNAGVSPFDAAPGLLGVVVLFAVLQIRKNDVSAWDQMENRKPRVPEEDEKNKPW